MALPELDVARIRRWCDARVPEHLWAELKVEADITPRPATIVEVRPAFDAEDKIIRFPVARLDYTKSTGLWSLNWRDRNLSTYR